MQSIYHGKVDVIQALRALVENKAIQIGPDGCYVPKADGGYLRAQAGLTLVDCKNFVDTLPLSFEDDKPTATDESLHDWALFNSNGKLVRAWNGLDAVGARNNALDYAEAHRGGVLRLCRIVADVVVRADIRAR